MAAQRMEAGLPGRPASYRRTPFVQSVHNRHMHGGQGLGDGDGEAANGYRIPFWRGEDARDLDRGAGYPTS